MMHDNTLRTIQETAVRAAGASILSIPGNDRLAFVVQDGKRELIPLPAAVRKHTLDDLDELCRFVVDYAKRVDAKEANKDLGGVVVFHSPTQVVAVLHDADRRDRATLTLARTGAWVWIEQAAKSPPKLTAKEFLLLLRTTLADRVEPDALHAWQVALRNVRLTTRATTDATTSHGLEKLGKEIEQQCAGAESIPEQLTVTAAVYRNVGNAETAAVVTFDVSIDFEAGKFVLTAIGDRVADAVDAAQVIVGDYIRDQAKLAAVFHGTP
ncbi:MAG: hypothetical protein QM775_16550 [Pirellulales bacterium]